MATKRKKIRTFLNYDFKEVKGEVNNEPSLTVPDQTISVRAMLERHQQGQPINIAERQEFFDEETHYPNIKAMDIEEIEQMKIELNDQQQKNREKYRELKKRQAEIDATTTSGSDSPADGQQEHKTATT